MMLLNPLDETQAFPVDSRVIENRVASAAALRTWLIKRVADAVRCRPEEIDPQQPFSELGVDSLTAFSLAGELAQWRRQDLSATLLWDFPTIDALVRQLEPSTPAVEQ